MAYRVGDRVAVAAQIEGRPDWIGEVYDLVRLGGRTVEVVVVVPGTDQPIWCLVEEVQPAKGK